MQLLRKQNLPARRLIEKTPFSCVSIPTAPKELSSDLPHRHDVKEIIELVPQLAYIEQQPAEPYPLLH